MREGCKKEGNAEHSDPLDPKLKTTQQSIQSAALIVVTSKNCRFLIPKFEGMGVMNEAEGIACTK